MDYTEIDTDGAAISGVRMDPLKAYSQNISLLSNEHSRHHRSRFSKPPNGLLFTNPLGGFIIAGTYLISKVFVSYLFLSKKL